MIGSRLIVACLLAIFAGSALAQSFPAKPITILCPCPPGGITVQYLSKFAQIASKYVGQPVISDGSRDDYAMVGLEKMARTAPPDGYRLSIMLMPALRVPHLRSVSWDPTRDFTYVIGLARFTFGVVVKSDSRFKTLGDLIDYAKAHPGEFAYGSLLRGTTPHLAMEELGLNAGVRFRHVPGSFAESVKALNDGRIMAIVDSAGWGPFVDAGTFRLLATFGELRSRWKAPTALELGFNVLSYAPFGIVGPKGIDPKVVKVLHDAFNRTLDDPEYEELIRRLELVDWYKSSADYADWAVDQFNFQRTLLRRTIGLGN